MTSLRSNATETEEGREEGWREWVEALRIHHRVLILINLSGFIWWGKKGGDRREESEIKSEGGQPEDLLLKGRNGIFRRIKR